MLTMNLYEHGFFFGKPWVGENLGNFIFACSHGGNFCYNFGYKATNFIWKSITIIFDYLDSYLDSLLFAGEFKHFIIKCGKNVTSHSVMWKGNDSPRLTSTCGTERDLILLVELQTWERGLMASFPAINNVQQSSLYNVRVSWRQKKYVKIWVALCY